jgi:hypothetical protein
MNVRGLLKIIVLLILLCICVLSFSSFIYFTSKLDIKKVLLKEGAFELSDRTDEFNFYNPATGRYNVIIRFLHPTPVNNDFVDRLIKKKVKYTVNVELRSKENKLIKAETVNQDTRIQSVGSQKYFEWYLLSFDGEKGEKYNVKIAFQSDDAFFNKVGKEIYVEEDFDHAAAIYWTLFKFISLMIFILSILTLLILGFLSLRKRGGRPQLENAGSDKGKIRGQAATFNKRKDKGSGRNIQQGGKQ